MTSSSAEAVLAILPNWLGDLVMVQPALARLRQSASLIAVGAPALVDLLQDCGEIDTAVPYDRRGSDRGLGGLTRTGRRCARLAPGAAYAFAPSLRAASLAWMSRAALRVGGGGEGRSVFLNRRPTPGPPSRETHLADSWLRWVDPHAPSGAAVPRMRPGPRGREAFHALRRELPVDFVAFAPSATYGPTKRWPEEHFADVAHALHEAHGWTPVYVAGAAPSEKDLCERLAHRTAGVSLAGRTGLPALTALLAGARLFVGNDSGPMHLAAAVGTPAVGIFGSTSPAWTAPRGPRATVAPPAPVDCTPCFSKTCPYDLECLRQNPPEAVLARAEQALRLSPEESV